MSIQVEFMPPISAVTGVNQVALESLSRTVGQVLEKLTQLYPGLKDELFDEEAKLDYIYQVTLNGKKLDRSRVMEEPVTDGDRLQIFAVLGGG